MSQRAITTLKEADLIACEDTRTSGVLLSHYGIDTQTFAFHQHNEHQKVHHLVEMLQSGRTVALITDAGMPGISDPGFLAVREAHQHQIPVVTIPGPDAVTTALLSSGLPCDRFCFEGFLPAKKGRKGRISALKDEERTTVLYESPHRVERLLREINELLDPDRVVAVCRELTKKFEEVIRGTIEEVHNELASRKSIKGEVVVILAGNGYRE